MQRHLRTILKERGAASKVKSEPRAHLQQVDAAIRSRRLPPPSIGLGRPIQLNRQKQISEEDMIRTKSHGREGSSQALTAFVAREKISSFLPSLNNYEIQYSTDLGRRNTEIVQDYSQPSYKSIKPASNKRSVSKGKKKGTKDWSRVEPADVAPQTVGAVTQRTEVSIGDFFEYTVKYSCRTAAGKTSANKQKTNQDCFVVVPCLNGRTYKHFFAVCDGHGMSGHIISRIVKQEFARRLARFKHSTAEFDQHHQKIITGYFNKVEQAINREKNVDADFSGSTCTSVWMNNSTLYCASVGDSRAIIVYEQDSNDVVNQHQTSFSQGENRIFTITQLSHQHKAERAEEAARIQESGGQVGRINGKGPLRIWKPGNNFPGLSMTRSFGDRVAHTLGVITAPEIFCYPMTRRERIMVLGSDGLWQFMTNLEVVQLVSRFYDQRDIDGACRALMEAARSRWQQNCKIIDDITFMIFFFGFN